MQCKDEGIHFPEWQPQYNAVLSEKEPMRLRRLVDAAETVIFNRLQALAENSEGSVERAALAAATRNLQRIQIETLGYPEWETGAKRARP
jgi:hypothetical protein